MSTAEELVVALRSEGANDVASDVNKVEEQVEQAGETTEETGAELDKVSRKLSGVMAAVLGGVAVAVGGLLSQVPVIGETVDILGGIVTALAFKLDEELRPALSDTNSDLRDTENAIFESQGFFEGLIITINGLGEAIQNTGTQALQDEIEDLTGITVPENWLDLGWDVITMDSQNALDTLKRTARNFGPDVATLIEGWFPNWAQNVRDGWTLMGEEFDRWGEIGSDLEKGFDQTLSDISTGFMEWASGLGSDAYTWGVNLIESFQAGIENRLNQLKNILDRIQTRVETEIGVDIGGGGGGNTTTTTTNSRGGFGGGGSGNAFAIDGRRVDEQTGRFGRDTTARRGI